MENKKKTPISLKDIGLPKIILMAAAGILLIVLSMPQQSKTETDEDEIKEDNITENAAYISQMEEKLEETLKRIDGVGKVEAMLTLEASKETILNKDEQIEEEKTKDDTKSSQVTKSSEETILTQNNGQPYIVKEIEPKVAGVVVVLEGGGNPVVVKEVSEAIQVLFDLEVNKIKVLKMEGAN